MTDNDVELVFCVLVRLMCRTAVPIHANRNQFASQYTFAWGQLRSCRNVTYDIIRNHCWSKPNPGNNLIR